MPTYINQYEQSVVSTVQNEQVQVNEWLQQVYDEIVPVPAGTVQWDGITISDYRPGDGTVSMINKVPHKSYKEEQWAEGYRAGFLDGLKCKEEDFL